MKARHLMIACLLLAVLTLGAAGAAEDSVMTDHGNITEVSAEPLDTDFKDDSILKDPDSEVDMEVDGVAQTVYYGKYVSCSVAISNQDADGSLYVYVDEMPEYIYGYGVSGNVNATCQSANYVSDFGNHTLFVKYVDNAGSYADTVRNFTFAVDDYELALSDNYGDAVLGEDYSFGINIPFDAKGTMIITHNGVEYVIPPESYYWYLTIPADNLLYGANEVEIHFIPEDGCKLPEKTVTDSFNGIITIKGPSNPVQVYGEVDDVVLALPKDANDNLILKSRGFIFRAARVVNGKAVISLDDLPCGKHKFEAIYIGSDYSVESTTFEFEVVPKVTVPVFAYNGKDTFSVEVTMSETTSGNLVIHSSFNNEEKTFPSAKGVINANLTVPATDTWVKVRYVQDDLTFEQEYWVGVRKTDPEFVMNVTVADIIKGRQLCANIEIPSGYGAYAEEPFDGYFTLFIDGTEAGKSQNPWIFYDTGSLDIGTHEWRVEFSNDCYYFAEAKSGTFDVGYFTCQFDENVTLGQGSIFAKTASDAIGIVSLYVDGIECDSKIVTDYVAVLRLPGDIAIGRHDIEIKYIGNYPEASMSGHISVDYDFILSIDSSGNYAYGQPVTVTVHTHNSATGNVSINVNDRNYELPLLNGEAEITLYDLECADYLVAASYPGDSRFPPKAESKAFTVGGYAVLGPKPHIHYGSLDTIDLLLPDDAQGNLTVEYDGKVYKSVKLTEGKASIMIGYLAPGIHRLHAYYDGGDYYVRPYDEDSFSVEITIIYSNVVNLNDDARIGMLVPDDAQGNIIMNLSGEIMELIPYGGMVMKAFNLSGFGDYIFMLDYNGTDYDIVLPDGLIHVIPADFTCPSVVSDGNNTISFTLPEDAKGNLSLYSRDALLFSQNISGQNASISLEGLNPGQYDFRIVYEDEKYGNYSRTVHVEVPNPAPSIEISNSGNDRNATFTFAIAKDATGAFVVKIDGASHYVEISQGIASLSLTNISMGKHEVHVQYLGDGKYSPASAEKTVDVTSSVPARIAADDITIIYSAGTLYSITVYAEGGFLAKGIDVTFEVNGKKVTSAKSDVKGVATFKITQKPGSYRITAMALGKAVTKKLTVKHILKLQKVRVKKSAKRLVIRATLLKVNGKYLKGKKVTLKFKGKKYVAKTNSKGIAKFTIKSKALKKLKKGKKVTYQATYLKDSVKCTVKVKK